MYFYLKHETLLTIEVCLPTNAPQILHSYRLDWKPTLASIQLVAGFRLVVVPLRFP